MRLLVLACALSGALGLTLSAHAQVISSFPADFSSSVNTDTSMWSYRYRPDENRNGTYLLLPTYGSSLGTWTPTNPNSWNTGGSGLPEMGRNTTGSSVSNTTASPSDTFPVTAGMFWMRPGNGQIAVLSWLFPFDTPQVIRSEAFDQGLGSVGGDGYTWYFEVLHADGTSTFAGSGGGSSGGDSGGGEGHYIFQGMMQPGDRFNYILDPKFGTTSTAVDDARALRTTISAVPEPSGFALILFGTALSLVFSGRLGAASRMAATEQRSRFCILDKKTRPLVGSSRSSITIRGRLRLIL
jgi:hypothetical protein